MQVDGELPDVGVQVQARLQVRDVERIADGVDMRAQQGVGGAEHGVDAELDLVAG